MAKNERSATKLDKLIGANIRKARLEFGISQEMLAEDLGISFQQVQKYERASNRIAASRLYYVAKFFDMKMEEFCE